MKVKNISQRYKQLYNDVMYIQGEYGRVHDYCGAWCNNDVMDKLLVSPTYKTAFKALIRMLETFYDDGTDESNLPVDKDKRLQKIREKWLDQYWEIE